MSKEDDDLSRLIESYTRQLFDDRNVSEANREKLWQYYYNHLSKGLNIGYNASSKFYDEDLANSLKYNIAQFSAFKETSFRKQLEDALVQDGKVLSWSQFKEVATALNVDYNLRWLRTEYDHTIATANMVEQWKQFEADADLYPNLKYVTVGDARVRDQHKAWDGLVLPINHLFWKTHLTPNDWGCRCNIEQTDEEVSDTIPELKLKSEFENNAALTGKIFNKNAYENDLTDLDIKSANSTANLYNKEARKLKDNEIKEWVQKEIPQGGKTISLSNFKTGAATLYRKNIKSISDHFTNPILKDMAKDIISICESASFKSTANLEESLIAKTSQNLAKKKARGVTDFNYYEFTYNGELYRLNVEVIDGKEYPFSINKITNAE
ncbi:hypothetical protein FIA58_013895 [Flavobacterium jejuense]|uniref:Phage head morphogenesis domain-containing protein n=1 Tax=Flavobacterium jejuense TaxID=1544455 RepID=A0ABX0IW88_9FLAO|nr:phage minor head protein [Flavobacterium jejuense]NHN26773.1 hypothetical protein [Flavobacterium jejuense]